MSKWTACELGLPPENVEVMTKIDDELGPRNEQSLKRHGNLWFFPDMSMYVYYAPTHWKPIDLLFLDIARRNPDGRIG